MARQPSVCRGGGSAAEQSSPSLGSGRATCPTPSLAHVSAATAAAARLFMSELLWEKWSRLHMPGPCDPGGPRELQDGTNTLGPVLQWPGKQEGSTGEGGKGHWAALLSAALYSAGVLFSLSLLSHRERSHQRGSLVTSQTAPRHLQSSEPRFPQLTQGLSRSRAQHLSPQPP